MWVPLSARGWRGFRRPELREGTISVEKVEAEETRPRRAEVSRAKEPSCFWLYHVVFNLVSLKTI